MASTNVPKTMRAILVPKTGPPSVLEPTSSQPVPEPAANEILVHNTLAGVNYIDTYFRSGLYPTPAGAFPIIIGEEAAGTVAAIGSDATTSGLKVGDRVVCMSRGSYAEYMSVPWARAVKIPDDIKDDDAVGAFLTGMTALSFTREAYPVKKGDWVLLHAAAGGLGVLMCQILNKLGARTIGTAGGPEKCALAKENGAEFVIDYKATGGKSWLEQVKELTNGEGVDVVYDSVGKDTWEGSLEAVRRKGTIVFLGNSSGPVPPVPLPKLSAKNSKICRPVMMNYVVTREELEYYANAVFDELRAGLKVKHNEPYPLEEAQRAQEDLEGRRTTGKLLLKI